ncbi:MAG TPA: TetR/AcrR family transcriptional regulator [Solirubrobacterales bacterium]|nr:TetR/AcrR family transcriptional regulator [Solirubrobacterales bacterium]
MADRESARERILEAACDLIAAEGIDDVRIARVAMRAGASTALVHHYFSTREELLEQALLHSFEKVGEERFAATGGEAPSATAALAEAIEECLPSPGPMERDWVLWVELWLRAAREPDLRPFAASLYGRYHDWLEEVLRRGVDAGEFTAPADLRALTDRTMALLDGLGIRALLHDPTMALDAARAQVAEFLAPQLGIDPAALLTQAV